MRLLGLTWQATRALCLAGYYLLKEWFLGPAEDLESDLELLAEIAQVDPDVAHDTAYSLCHAVGADQIATEYHLKSSDRHLVAEHFSKLYRPEVRKHVIDGALQGLLDYDEENSGPQPCAVCGWAGTCGDPPGEDCHS